MAKQTINNGESGLSARNKLNDNFTEVYNSVSAISAAVLESDVRALTGNWQDTFTTVNSNSSNWESVYSNVVSNSATYATIDFANNKFFTLSGGLISGATRINGNLTIYGDLSSTGTQTFANTVFSTTSALSVVHVGSGPAVWIGNNGSGDIASFYDIDQNVEVLHVGGINSSFPNVGVKVSNPNKDFTVNGEISANNTIYDANGNSNQWNSAYSTVQTNSAVNWSYQGTDLKALSSNWQSTYTTVQTSSSTWGTGGGSGGSTIVQIFSSSGTWTKPANAKSVDILCIGGGGGGGSGRVNAGQNGGGAGAGGGYTWRQFPASMLSATETVTVGASGIGGAPVTAINSSGNNGTPGGDSSFGTLPWVFAGGGGGGVGSAGGAGGSPNLRTAWIGGYPGAGGTAANGAGAANGSNLGAGGGGGGGGCNTTGTWFIGGNGFPSFASATTGGQSQGGLTQGAAGGNGVSLNSYCHAGGGGAGGAGGVTVNGGAGGSGGLYGGGGGGGGCQGTTTAFGTLSSGAGGNGAQGIVVVTTYF